MSRFLLFTAVVVLITMLHSADALQFSSLWNVQHNSTFTFPVIDETSVYVADNAGYVYAYDKVTGLQLWSWRTNATDPGAHPTVYGGYLAAQAVTADGAPGLVVLNKTTGIPIYQLAFQFPMNIHVTAYNSMMYFSTEPSLWNATIYAVRIEDGTTVWSKYYKACTRIRADRGVIYFGTHTGSSAANASTGELLWHFSTNGLATNEPNFDTTQVYFADFHSFYAVDRATGHLRWNTSNFTGLAANGATVAFGRVYFETFKHDVFAFDVVTGDQVARTHGFISISKDYLVAYEDRLIVPSIGDNQLHAFDKDLNSAIVYGPSGGWTQPVDSWPNEIVIDFRAKAGFVAANTSLWALKLF